AAVADLFGVPIVDGTVEAARLQAGGVAVDTLSATAQSTDGTTDFEADADLENGATARASGALSPENGGYRLRLDEASLGQGPVAARLVEPASLLVVGETIAVDSLALDVAGGRVSAQGSIADTLDLDVSLARL